ncbi:aminotransferase class V-fold PLP-dependent enzyme [Alienimonas sp. DA493]|uniref:aminotransferase class V-fold PLP-dependent enzyme n=1 Tax=Alienimonas sp. DA493 TaxID=3373605 RepID=UPI0037550429
METVYLDHAATSLPKAPGVAEAMRAALGLPSPGRGNARRGAESAALLTRCRGAVARLLGVGSPERVVFTAGGTDALNLALFGLLKPGDHAVVGVLEHTSVTRPLAALRARGVAVHPLDCTEDGFYRPEELESVLRDAPAPVKLVALSHGSNVAGTVQPVAELAAVCRARGALLLLDACQTAGHVPIDVDSWGVDLLATGGHKGLLGPPGVGVLTVGERAEPQLNPARLGGTGAGGGEAMPPDLPHRLEPGTPNLPGIAGLLAAVEWIEREGVDALHARSVERLSQLIDRLTALPGVGILGPPDASRRCGLVAVTLPGWEPTEAAAVLDASFGVECRAGLHCAPSAHAHFVTGGRGGAVRFSVGPFTTPAEVEAAADAVAALLA